MATLNDKLARLISVRTEAEAGIIVSGLEEHGIRAVMSGIHTANFRAEAPGSVDVLVAQDQLENAQEVLEQISDEQKSIDWSQVDVGEPEDEEDVPDADE
jgi:hypothetical protein